MTDAMLRAILARRDSKVDLILDELFHAAPYQLCELLVLAVDGPRETFHCRYFMLKDARRAVVRSGREHLDENLNTIDPEQGSAWRLLKSGAVRQHLYFKDVRDPEQFEFSDFAKAIKDPNGNFQRLSAAYGDVLFRDHVRGVNGLKDMAIGPLRGPEQSLVGIFRLFNRITDLPDFDGNGLADIFQLVAGFAYRTASFLGADHDDDVAVLGRLRSGIVLQTRNPRMKSIFFNLRKLAGTDRPLLIQGETGVGKDVIAQWIHENSPRAQRDFLAINCAAMPDQLLESELFGHKRGAHSTAATDKLGLFQVADRGTLFLDEVAEMSPAMQAKLLRVLQNGEFLPVGAVRPERTNVRVISATCKDLGAMVAARTFRMDLFYRLTTMPIHLPPLRERREDIPSLISSFIEREREVAKGSTRGILPSVVHDLAMRDWRGNVRELERHMELLCLFAESEMITAADLPASPSDSTSAMRNAKAAMTSLLRAAERHGVKDKISWLLALAAECALEQASNVKQRAHEYLSCAPGTFNKYLSNYEDLFGHPHGERK